MKCPKCAYVGFEPSDRCRHCGYDFSLMGETAAPAAPVRVEPVRFPGATRERAASSAPAVVEDLPLQTPVPDDPAGVVVDLFAEPPKARTPLAVRRATERPRPRATTHLARRPRTSLLDAPGADTAADSTAESPADDAAPAAPAMARLLSGVLDLLVLAVIDAAVVYLTAQIAGVPTAAIVELPLAPLVTFVLGLNVAYLAVFTANGGQTLGKMAAGLRVEGTDRPLTFGGALVRVAVALAGGLAAGAGFLPALWRTDGRAVHDQIAHTRVVRITA